MNTRELNRAKKHLACLKCGRRLKTTRCRRTCAYCARREAGAAQHGINLRELTEPFRVFNSETSGRQRRTSKPGPPATPEEKLERQA